MKAGFEGGDGIGERRKLGRERDGEGGRGGEVGYVV